MNKSGQRSKSIFSYTVRDFDPIPRLRARPKCQPGHKIVITKKSPFNEPNGHPEYKDQVKELAGLVSFVSGLALFASGMALSASGLASFVSGLASLARTLPTRAGGLS